MLVQAYLFFDGTCEEALQFYERAIGAKIEALMRFSECPDQQYVAPGTHDKIMHANFRVGDTQLMASDGNCSGAANFAGVSLSITVTSNGDADRLFNALADGGQIQMPLGETFFAHRFGMVADKFGVSWMIIHPKQPA